MGATAIAVIATGLTMVISLVVAFLLTVACNAPTWLGFILCPGVAVGAMLGAARYLLGSQRTTDVTAGRAAVVGAVDWIALALALAVLRHGVLKELATVSRDPPGSWAAGAIELSIINAGLVGSSVLAGICVGLAVLYRLKRRSPPGNSVSHS